MKKLIILTLGVLAICGCATSTQEKTRSLDMNGAYVSDSGKLAVGSVKIQSAKAGAEAAMISYTESVPLFSDKRSAMFTSRFQELTPAKTRQKSSAIYVMLLRQLPSLPTV